MSFAVKLEQFDGPLHLLLELIQNEKLPITEVSLATVADGFVRYIQEHDVPASELADFLVMATRLLLLKSQAILPVPAQPEEDPSTLALQLRLYQEFVEASEKMEALFDGPRRSFARAQALVVRPAGVELPPGLGMPTLRSAFATLLERLEPFFRLQQAAIERIVTVKERLQEIHDAILNRTRLTFRELAAGGKSRVDVVVSFLALLELIKQQVVSVVQKDTFHEIEIKRVE